MCILAFQIPQVKVYNIIFHALLSNIMTNNILFLQLNILRHNYCTNNNNLKGDTSPINIDCLYCLQISPCLGKLNRSCCKHCCHVNHYSSVTLYLDSLLIQPLKHVYLLRCDCNNLKAMFIWHNGIQRDMTIQLGTPFHHSFLTTQFHCGPFYMTGLSRVNMAASQIYIWTFTIFLFPTLTWGLLSDFKMCGDSECESKQITRK